MKLLSPIGLFRFSLMVLCVSCLGCDTGESEVVLVADPATRPLSENLKELVDLFDELSFCVAEDAGAKTTKSVVDRLVVVLNGTGDSVQASSLSVGDQTKLLASIEQARAACQKQGLDNAPAFEALCEELKSPLKSVRRFL